MGADLRHPWGGVTQQTLCEVLRAIALDQPLSERVTQGVEVLAPGAVAGVPSSVPLRVRLVDVHATGGRQTSREFQGKALSQWVQCRA